MASNKQAFTATSGINMGKNIVGSIDASGILTMKIDLSKRLGESKSGKSMLIATTSGNKSLGDTDVTVGINIYTEL